MKLAAQNFSISGKITDVSGAPLPGAVATLQRPQATEKLKNTVAAADGSFKFSEVQRGPYLLEITFVGMENLQQRFFIRDQNLDLGTLVLKDNSLILNQVEVKEQTLTSVQRGDTTELNSKAFKVMKDADAQNLIEKMPGMSVQNGQLQAQGEKVQQVLVDGKPFFGNDPAAALKALPAEVIEKVQVFDAQSDQANFTGIRDGNTVKTLNIVTKSGMQAGQFGKIYAGYGHEEKYQGGANLNFFDGNRRVSLMAMSNNINQQNFSMDDILGATGNSGRGGMGGGGRPGGGGGGRPGGGGGGSGDFLVNPTGGIARTHAVGLNYTDFWGKKWEVNGSYFFNKSRTNSDERTVRQFLAGEQLTSEIYEEYEANQADNTNHRANFRIEFKADSMNSFILRPRLTFQKNVGESNTTGATTLASEVLNSANNFFNSNLTSLNFSNSLLWRHRFQKKGRTFSVDFTNGFAPKSGKYWQSSLNQYSKPQPSIDTLNQRATLEVGSWNAAVNLEYTEPISKNAQISVDFQPSFQQESSDRLLYDVFYDGSGETRNDNLSNVFSNDYQTQRAGLAYNFSKGQAMNFNFRLRGQWASLANEQTFPQSGKFDRTFFNLLPSGFFRFNFDKNRNIRMFYRSNTQLPTVEQLQNVVNNTNPLQLTAGNPNLGQAEQHFLFARYQASNPTKSTNLFAMVHASVQRDFIGSSTFFASSDDPIFSGLNVQPGAQLTLPVNLEGYWNARTFVSYGLPLKKIKSNLNFDFAYNFTRTPGLVNSILNLNQNHSVGGGLSLTSNVSTKLDFTVSSRPTWNFTQNSTQTAANAQFLSQNSRVSWNWQIIEGFVLRTDLTHNLTTGRSEGFNQNYWLWNLGIGKKLFKNERGELTLAVNDLLNQNRDIQRNVNAAFIEDIQTNALTRFVMLSFTYNLRNFNSGKKKTAPAVDEEQRMRERWRN